MRNTHSVTDLVCVKGHHQKFTKKAIFFPGKITNVDELTNWRKSISDRCQIDGHILRESGEYPARRLNGALTNLMNITIKEKYALFLYRLCCLIFSFMVGVGVLMVNSLAITIILEFYLQLVVGGFALAALRRRVYR